SATGRARSDDQQKASKGDEDMNLVVGAIPLAAIYAICAFAWVILYRTTGVLNMATGASMVLGAFCFNMFVTDLGWPWWAATLATAMVAIAFGALVQFGILRRLAGQ